MLDMPGWVSRQRGLDTESVFFYAMHSVPLGMRPRWLRKVWEATAEEDRLGCDGFAELDVGVVILQIKTSIRHAWPYVSKYRYKHRFALVVAIEPGANEMDIRTATLGGLFQIREHMLSNMGRWRPQWNAILAYSH